MGKNKKNYYDMNKEELIDIAKKWKNSDKYSNYFKRFFALFIVSTALFMSNVMLLALNVNILNNIINPILIISSSGIVISGIGLAHYGDKTTKAYNLYIEYADRLDDIITMEYEKKRYQNDKKFEKENVNTISAKTKNTNEKIKLLEEYKQELLQYDLIDENDKEINNELEYFQYTKKMLNDLK